MKQGLPRIRNKLGAPIPPQKAGGIGAPILAYWAFLEGVPLIFQVISENSLWDEAQTLIKLGLTKVIHLVTYSNMKINFKKI